MTYRASVASIGNKLVDDLFNSFAEHGPAAIARVRTERPSDYLRIIAAMTPKQVALQGGALEGISDADLEYLLAALAGTGI